jgi:branched-chain amino acid aminotransferase
VARLDRGVALIDGERVAIEDASIPLMDTGFFKGDHVYDVAAVWDGMFFRLDDHLARFAANCRKLRLTPSKASGEIADDLHDLVGASGLRFASVGVICTRGVTRDGERDPRRFENRLYCYAVPYVWLIPADRQLTTGMDAVVTETVRRVSPRAIDPTVKTFQWGDLIRGLFEAYDRGGHFPILLGDAGEVTEGAGYNVFLVEQGRLATPSEGVLEGITRRTALELAERDGIPTAVEPIPGERLYAADELFATTTSGGVMPITMLDGRPVADGRPGPIARQLRAAYWDAHSDPRYTRPIRYREPHSPVGFASDQLPRSADERANPAI